VNGINICDPISRNDIYPRYTEELIMKSYNECTKNKNNNVNYGLIGSLAAVTGFVVITVSTGGGAALLGGLATLGFGSLAAGGLGIKGGIFVLSGIGFLSGITVHEFSDMYCKNQAINILDNEINKCHYDYYYNDNKVIFQGYFCDNLPQGQGKLYDNKGSLIYQGRFINGIPEVCYDYGY